MTEKTLKNGNPINKATQFGQPNGNQRGHGFWKKEETGRYKLEQMLKMTDKELDERVIDDNEASFIKSTAKALKLARSAGDLDDMLKVFIILEKCFNQVYGYPKQEIEQTNIEPPAPRMAKTKDEE